jgi:hypothetical protein
MKTVKIRDLRGPKLEGYARAGQLVGLTRDRALIAVMVPMAQAWIEHLIDYNWSRVVQSLAAAEGAIDSQSDMVTLDSAVETANASRPGRKRALLESVDRDDESSIDETGGVIDQLAATISLMDPHDTSVRTTTTLGIRQLSAHRIAQASENQELLVLTSDRRLLGLVVPISEKFIEFLVSQNLSRVMYNIQRAEKESRTGNAVTTLDAVLHANDVGDAMEAPHDAPDAVPVDQENYCAANGSH